MELGKTPAWKRVWRSQKSQSHPLQVVEVTVVSCSFNDLSLIIFSGVYLALPVVPFYSIFYLRSKSIFIEGRSNYSYKKCYENKC